MKYCVTNSYRHNGQGLFSWASHCLGIPGILPHSSSADQTKVMIYSSQMTKHALLL